MLAFSAASCSEPRQGYPTYTRIGERQINQLRCASMIIQQVIKGLSNLTDQEVDSIFKTGILCNWWRTNRHLPQDQVPDRLTQPNLDWHQNSFDKPDPTQGGQPFSLNTPFISTTARTMERSICHANKLTDTGLEDSTLFCDRSMDDGWLALSLPQCLIGKPAAVRMEAFSEELPRVEHLHCLFPFLRRGRDHMKLVISDSSTDRARRLLVDRRCQECRSFRQSANA